MAMRDDGADMTVIGQPGVPAPAVSSAGPVTTRKRILWVAAAVIAAPVAFYALAVVGMLIVLVWTIFTIGFAESFSSGPSSMAFGLFVVPAAVIAGSLLRSWLKYGRGEVGVWNRSLTLLAAAQPILVVVALLLAGSGTSNSAPDASGILETVRPGRALWTLMWLEPVVLAGIWAWNRRHQRGRRPVMGPFLAVLVLAGGCAAAGATRNCYGGVPDDVIDPLPPGATVIDEHTYVAGTTEPVYNRSAFVTLAGRTQSQAVDDASDWYRSRGWQPTGQGPREWPGLEAAPFSLHIREPLQYEDVAALPPEAIELMFARNPNGEDVCFI